MHSSKKVFLTGGTGLIGKELWMPLAAAGFDVYALTVDDNMPSVPGITWIKGNLFDDALLAHTFARIKPQYLLNMAWAATGDYQTSNINFEFVRAGLSLLKYFAVHGGKRAVFAGTCFEYAFKDAPLKETDSVNPPNVYAYCKNALRGLAECFCQANGISFAYGRIFYVYGRGEHEKRLTASIIHTLKAEKRVQINHSQLVKDYIYTKDIAAAFTALLDSQTQGAVNICTGKGISLAEYARTLARLMGREDLLDLKTLPTNQPTSITGDNTRLTREVGFTPRYSLEEALKEII